jgi:hypothetical protein
MNHPVFQKTVMYNTHRPIHQLYGNKQFLSFSYNIQINIFNVCNYRDICTTGATAGLFRHGYKNIRSNKNTLGCDKYYDT